MSNILIGLGWFGFVLAAVYFYINDQLAGAVELKYIDHTTDILILSAVMVIGGYLMKFLGPKLGIGHGRCKKCGKVIEKNEIYCFNHRIESIREAQDKGRAMESRSKK